MLKAGDKAPDFTLQDAAGNAVSLRDFRGKKVVLYFYSKDNTSGCTKQACGFRDLHAQFAEKGAVVIGVSKDTAESHSRFAEKHSLPFVLLADPEHKVLEQFGVWVEKKLYGKVSMGTQRATFLIDEEGTIAAVVPRAKPDTNAADMLAMLEG